MYCTAPSRTQNSISYNMSMCVRGTVEQDLWIFSRTKFRMKMISVPQFGKNVVEWVGGVLGLGRWYRHELRIVRLCRDMMPIWPVYTTGYKLHTNY